MGNFSKHSNAVLILSFDIRFGLESALYNQHKSNYYESQKHKTAQASIADRDARRAT